MTMNTIDSRVKELQELEEMKKELEKEIEEIKAELQTEMGEIEELETPKFVIKWTFITSSRFDSKTFKTNYPKIYAAFSRETTSRRFTVTTK